MGTRDPADTARREDVAAWAADHDAVPLDEVRRGHRRRRAGGQRAGGDVALGILESAGAENLAGKVLLDVSNPLDDSHGFPPHCS